MSLFKIIFEQINLFCFFYKNNILTFFKGCFIKGTSKNPLIYGVSEPTGIGSTKIGQYDPLWMRNAPKLMLFDPSSALFLDNRRINP